MFRILVVIMIVVPALEIWGLITVGKLIGGWQTFALILLTGFVGAFLARKEASRVWNYARMQLAAGQLPGRSILDGICIFAGGLLLLTPGFLTDTLGFLLVMPATRPFFRNALLHFIRTRINRGDISFFSRRF
jgi:UPF0716 protein FxsA